MPVLHNRRGDRPARQRNDEDGTRKGSSRAARRANPPELPSYEAPLYPLNAKAKRDLAELSTLHDTRRYEKHIKSSINHLGRGVAAGNDSLYNRKLAARRAAAKRAKNAGQANSADETDFEASYTELEAKVVPLALQMERALRDLIDRQAALADRKTATAEVISHIQSQPAGPHHRRPRRRQQGGNDDRSSDGEGEDTDMDDPVGDTTGVLDMIKEAQARRATEYENMDVHQRYGLNNDYIAFRRLWHDALNGDGGAPMPDARRWFSADGNPVVPSMGKGATPDIDEDEELVVTEETISYTCPLSLLEFEQPFSNRVCKHTFEKNVIEDYIRRNGPKVRCPQTGCLKVWDQTHPLSLYSSIPRIFWLLNICPRIVVGQNNEVDLRNRNSSWMTFTSTKSLCERWSGQNGRESERVMMRMTKPTRG
jgi:hypothetical protein